jgi:uncharacterized SAM-binding protein YcdF (DUF218 family)
MMGIIVPGGGLLATGDIPLHTKLRADKAVEVLQGCAPGACRIIALSAGTTHKPAPHDARGFPITEAAATARYLLSLGVSKEAILEENMSLDTIGNAYFLRTIHTDVLGIRNLVIVTNKWHLARTEAIFDIVFSLEPVPPPICRGPPTYEIDLIAVEDGLPANQLTSRRDREASSLAAFRRTAPLWGHSMAGLHTWLFTQHSAYAVKRHVDDMPSALDPAVLATY